MLVVLNTEAVEGQEELVRSPSIAGEDLLTWFECVPCLS